MAATKDEADEPSALRVVIGESPAGRGGVTRYMSLEAAERSALC
jgi:hypothetical protein